MENKCQNIYFQMNCNVKVATQSYVSLQNIGGYSDTATVTITVEDFDNLNPYFHHSHYEAPIEENQVNDVRRQDQCLTTQMKPLSFLSTHRQAHCQTSLPKP